MSMKLRELIREVRQCKSASSERSVIAKELAAIRTAIKDKDKLEFRHRNVAKLMYVDMLGYPTHFGQMEVLKLLASKPFVEKRLGYLALMQLLDENTEVLMLATQSLKQDMCHENPFIVGLALCAMGNIASTDISRDLARELEKLLKHPNPYIRKKALCTAIRVINRVPEMCDEYFKCALVTLEDSSQGHGSMVAAVQLLYSICSKSNKHCKKLRKYSSHIISRLSSLLRSSYDPDHDIGGVTDPFLQVHLLQLLRLISKGDKKLGDDVESALAQIATNTESNKNPGNSILYECVRTIMCIEKGGSLHVLAINILGRFLVNRDNNVRYVALNALCNAVHSNTDAIQRHRNTIVECLKDADLTIRKRALDLIYALTNKNNVKSLARDLINFLIVSNTTTTSVDRTKSESPKSKNNKKSKKSSKNSSKNENSNNSELFGKNDKFETTFINKSTLSVGELEFRQELASKICMVIERYAPSRKWHIDTVVQVMATTTATGFNREQSVISSLFILISNSVNLQSYCTYKLYECINKLQIDSDPIRQLSTWLIGEYGGVLLDASECANANKILQENHGNANGNTNGVNSNTNGNVTQIDLIENITISIGPFSVKSADEVIGVLKFIIGNESSSATTKGYALTALLKTRHRFSVGHLNCDEQIAAIYRDFGNAQSIEVQQRSVEYLSLFDSTDESARLKILKAMPVPNISKMFDKQRESLAVLEAQRGNDSDGSDDSDASDDSGDDLEKKGDSGDSSDDSDDSESSESSEESDSASDVEERRKQKKKRKKRAREKAKRREKRIREKEKEKMRRKKEKNSEKNSKNNSEKRKKKSGIRSSKSKEVVVPVLAGPDEMGNQSQSQSKTVNKSNAHLNGDSNGNTNGSNTNGNNLLDFMGNLDSVNASVTNDSKQINNNNNSNTNGSNLIDDILGMGIVPSVSSVSSVPAMKAASQPFSAFNKNGVSATLNFSSSSAVGVCRVLAVFHNSNSSDISQFSFMVAVPKYMKLQIKPANGTNLLALSQNSITQKLQLTNSEYGKKPFMIRVQIQYNMNGQSFTDKSQVQFPDNCC